MTPPPLAAEDRPRLAAGVRVQLDKATSQPVLLFPEGLVQLNATGAAIVGLIDGQRSVDEIIAELGRQFAVDGEVLRNDVSAYLSGLRENRLIEVAT